MGRVYETATPGNQMRNNKVADSGPEEFAGVIKRIEELIEERSLLLAARQISIARKRFGARPSLVRQAVRICELRRRLRLANTLIERFLAPDSVSPGDEMVRARYLLLERGFKEAREAVARARGRGLNNAAARRLDARSSRGLSITNSGRNPSFRHIAMGGVSFSGSTLMSALLSSLPDTANIGESLHLTHKVDKSFENAQRLSALASGQFDWERDELQDLFPCAQCGPRCKVFDNDFRRRLAENVAADWYGLIWEKLEARRLVSSDKNAATLLDHDPTREFDLVVVFKSPSGAWRSTLKFMDRVRRSNSDRPILRYNARRYLNVWSENYLSLLRELQPRGASIFLNWEEFERAPHAHFERVCKLLNIECDLGVFDNLATGHHAFGGNPELRPARPGEPVKIEVRPSSAKPLSVREQREVERHCESDFVHRLLMSRYRQQFSDI